MNTRVLKRLALVGVVIFVGLLILVALNPAQPRSEQIKQQCQEEFGSEGETRVNECAIKIMTDELEKGEQAKMERAAR